MDSTNKMLRQVSTTEVFSLQQPKCSEKANTNLFSADNCRDLANSPVGNKVKKKRRMEVRLEKGVRKEASSFFFFLALLPPTRTFLRTHAYGRERAILDLSPIPRPLYALTTVHSGPFPLSLPFYSRLYFLPFAFCAPAYEEEDFLCSYPFFFSPPS